MKVNNICRSTGKVMLSEAAATRKVDQYDRIRRYYLCGYCKHFHITRLGAGLMRESGLKAWKRKKKKEVTPDEIEARMKYLKEQIHNK